MQQQKLSNINTAQNSEMDQIEMYNLQTRLVKTRPENANNVLNN